MAGLKMMAVAGALIGVNMLVHQNCQLISKNSDIQNRKPTLENKLISIDSDSLKQDSLSSKEIKEVFEGLAKDYAAHQAFLRLSPEKQDSIILEERKRKQPYPFNLEDKYAVNNEDLGKYNRWVSKTLEESAGKNENAIIIDKSKYVLYLIENGKLKNKYPIELGRNPFDDKKEEGDMCTPEGMYEIETKKDVGQSVFHRAFLINYPNEIDRQMRKTGSLIEIHGHGTGFAGNEEGGFNWTLGCIALSDNNIDEIFSYIHKGSPVTIVKYNTKLE